MSQCCRSKVCMIVNIYKDKRERLNVQYVFYCIGVNQLSREQFWVVRWRCRKSGKLIIHRSGDESLTTIHRSGGG